jgi:imidazolonepropionase-like amidohydrolase
MMNRWITLILSILFLTGCASVNNTSDSSSADNKKAPPPDSINYYKPNNDVPDHIKNLMGRWEGDWDGVLNSYVIFERVTKNTAYLIYGWGANPSLGIYQGGYQRRVANLRYNADDSTVSIRFPNVTGMLSSDGSVIKAVYRGRSKIELKQTEMPGYSDTALAFTNAKYGNQLAPAPDKVSYKKPAADVPKNIQNLLGRWEGNWGGQLNSYMIFEEVTTTEAKLIYGWGTLPSFRINQAGYIRYTATINIKDAKSKVNFSYNKTKGSLSADGKTINAVFDGRSRITMKKTEDPFGKLPATSSVTSSKVQKKKAIVPADIVYQKPAFDIPSSIQGLLGQWEGELSTGQHVFVFVEKVSSDKAYIVYSWGTNPRRNVRNRGYRRYIANLTSKNDELRFNFSIGSDLPPLSGSLSPDGKSIIAKSGGWRISLKKIANPVFGSEIERYDGVKTGLIVFKNVNLITMRDDKVIPSQTVVIQDDRIKRVLESDSVDIPAGATIIDGKGEKYLMPGLADMHVHLNRSSYLKLLVANGVTTVRNMWGMDFHRILREDINHKQRVGPTIYSTGALLDGFPKYWPRSTGIRTVEDARNAVLKTKEDGFDFVKVYDRLSEENYNAIISTARELDIPVVGHIPTEVGFDKAVAAGQYSFEHLYGATDRPWDWLSKKTGASFKEYLEKSVVSGVWNCPTLVLFQAYEKNRSDLESQPELKYMNRDTIEYWNKSPAIDLQDQGRQNRLDTVKALNDAGANLILGTDTPNNWVIPGFSIHDELSLFVEAGLTPYEAIKTGTVNATIHMKKLSEFGTIEKGKRADLILCDANPFDDVANISSPTGVMTNGIWYPRAALDQMLDEVETEVQMLGAN